MAPIPFSECLKQRIILTGGHSDDSGTSDSRCCPGASRRQAAGGLGSREAPSRRIIAAAEAPEERTWPLGRPEYRFERRGHRRGPPGNVEEFPQGRLLMAAVVADTHSDLVPRQWTLP